MLDAASFPRLDEHVSNRSRLSEIVIGLHAAREFEDMYFANQLYGVVAVVKAMKAGKL